MDSAMEKHADKAEDRTVHGSSAEKPLVDDFNLVSAAQSAKLGLATVVTLWSMVALAVCFQAITGTVDNFWSLASIPVAVLALGSLSIPRSVQASAYISIFLHIALALFLRFMDITNNDSDILGVVGILGVLVFAGLLPAAITLCLYLAAVTFLEVYVLHRSFTMIVLGLSHIAAVILALGAGLIALRRANKAREKIRIEAALDLRRIKTAQSALLRTLTLEFDAPLANAKLLLTNSNITPEIRQDLYRITRQLTTLLDEVERQASDAKIAPTESAVVPADIRSLIYDVERQMRPLLAARSIQFNLERLDLPVNNYRVDAERLRALLLLLPRAKYGMHTIARALNVSIRAVAINDDIHELEISYSIDKSLYSAQQIRQLLAPASKGMAGKENVSADAMTADDVPTDSPIARFTDDKLLQSGLGQAAEWVTAMNGRLAVDGDEASGYEVRIVLPVEPISELAASTILPTDLILDHRDVLIIDDDPTHRLAASRVLKGVFGAQVITADNGEEALKAMRDHSSLALVISDFFMPDMNGEELRQKALALYPKLPVVLLSAGLLQREVVKLQADNAEILMKPLTDEKLRSLLASGRLQIPTVEDATPPPSD